MSPSSIKLRAGVVMLLAALSGCGGPTYEYADVEGKVTLDGKPLVGVVVKFYPETDTTVQPPFAMAMTDESGNFRLQIDENQPGAVVGRSIAVVRWPVRDRASPPIIPDALIPTKYSVVTESPLKFDIKPGGPQTINLSLHGV